MNVLIISPTVHSLCLSEYVIFSFLLSFRSFGVQNSLISQASRIYLSVNVFGIANAAYIPSLLIYLFFSLFSLALSYTHFHIGLLPALFSSSTLLFLYPSLSLPFPSFTLPSLQPSFIYTYTYIQTVPPCRRGTPGPSGLWGRPYWRRLSIYRS